MSSGSEMLCQSAESGSSGSANRKRNSSCTIGFHFGATLGRIADMYPTLLLTILEQVQNALDAGASRIRVFVDAKLRKIMVQDNGSGVLPVDMSRALGLICKSQKQAGKLGRFGMGVISPLTKCRYFTFTSGPAGHPYTQWTFEKEAIVGSETQPIIPLNVRDELRFCDTPTGRKGGVWWRTEVYIANYSSDRVITAVSAESIRSEILQRFSRTMLRLKTVVTIAVIDEDGEESRLEFRAAEYAGRPLPVRVIEGEDGSKITFRLYLAKGGKGKVVIGEAGNDYRLPFERFAQMVNGLLPDKAADVFQSTALEGEILSDRLELAVSREKMVHTEAVFHFCLALETWAQNEGRQYLEEGREEQEAARLQRLGVQSLNVIEKLLVQPEFRDLLDLLSTFRYGSIGRGHVEKEKTAACNPTPLFPPGAIRSKRTRRKVSIPEKTAIKSRKKKSMATFRSRWAVRWGGAG